MFDFSQFQIRKRDSFFVVQVGWLYFLDKKLNNDCVFCHYTIAVYFICLMYSKWQINVSILIKGEISLALPLSLR